MERRTKVCIGHCMSATGKRQLMFHQNQTNNGINRRTRPSWFMTVYRARRRRNLFSSVSRCTAKTSIKTTVLPFYPSLPTRDTKSCTMAVTQDNLRQRKAANLQSDDIANGNSTALLKINAVPTEHGQERDKELDEHQE